MTQRLNWYEIRGLVEKYTGPVRKAQPVTEGRNSEIAVIVHTDSGSTFIKGLREDHPRVWTQESERLINPFVRSVTAELRWSHRGDGWHLLGFEFIRGDRADYSPESADLPKVVEAMQRLQRIRRPQYEMKRAEQRWSAYSDRPELFAGDALLHTEWTPSNVIAIEDAAYIVDWAWPTQGAGWIDPACWGVWLIASGHSPEAAEGLISRMPTWPEAPHDAVTEFVGAQAAMWKDIAEDAGEPWTKDMAEAAQRWRRYRG